MSLGTLFFHFFQKKLSLGHKMSGPPCYSIAEQQIQLRSEHADKQKTIDAIGSPGSAIKRKPLPEL